MGRPPPVQLRPDLAEKRERRRAALSGEKIAAREVRIKVSHPAHKLTGQGGEIAVGHLVSIPSPSSPDLIFRHPPLLSDVRPFHPASVQDLGGLNSTGLKEPSRPIPGRLFAQESRTLSVRPLQDLDVVPILTRTKAGKGLARTVPSPEKIYREGPNKTDLMISVTEDSSVLNPAMLICLSYISRSDSVLTGRKKKLLIDTIVHLRNHTGHSPSRPLPLQGHQKEVRQLHRPPVAGPQQH